MKGLESILYLLCSSKETREKNKAFRDKLYASYDKFIEEKWLLPPNEIRFILKEGGDDYLMVHTWRNAHIGLEKL